MAEDSSRLLDYPADEDNRSGLLALRPTAPVASSRVSRLASAAGILWSSAALVSEGYNAVIMGNVLLFLQLAYPADVTPHVFGQIMNSWFIGQMFGLVGFGLLIDRVGRKTGAIFTTLFLILGVIMSAVAKGKTNMGLLWMLVVARGLAGFGAGGEYPVCTTTASEAAEDHPSGKSSRGFFVAISTILSIDIGSALASLTPWLILHFTNNAHYELVWRLCLGLGAIIPLGIFYFRVITAPSETYAKHGSLRLSWSLIMRKYWVSFLGTTGVWATFMWVAVPFSIFASTVSRAINPNGSMTSHFAYATLIQSFCIPGGIVGGYCADRYGRKRTLLTGFLLQSILGVILAMYMRDIQRFPVLFLVLYGIFLFLGEAGPGSTIFVITAETYPTALRGLVVGVSCALAKIAAAISIQLFDPILVSWPDDPIRGQQTIFWIGSVFCILGVVITKTLIPEHPAGRDLDHADMIFRGYIDDRED